MNSAWPPAARISSQTRRPRSVCTSMSATRAPSSANSRATPSPIPEAAPLIQLTCPSSLLMEHTAIILPPRAIAADKATSPSFELRDGDRVLFLGNTLIERDRYYGYLETLLTSRFHGRHMTFRNMGWSGDTVDIQERPLNFGDLHTHITGYKP